VLTSVGVERATKPRLLLLQLLSYPGDTMRDAKNPYAALAAFLGEHRLCRPGLNDPDVSEALVALWSGCGAAMTVELQIAGDKPR
jgi:hypothetical protein